MAAAAAPQAALQPTPTVQTHCFICPPPHQTLATVCTQIQCPTHPFPCGETLLPTPQTHCFICPPHTQAIHCPTNPVPCDTMGPTPLTHCFICPPHQTLATVCTQIGCPTQPVVCHPTQPIMCHPTLQLVCQPIHTQPVACGVLPPSFGCQINPQQGGAAQPQAMAAMAQGPALPGGGGLRTTWFDCHTNMAGCTVHICAQAAPQAQVLPPHTIHNSQCICPTPSAVGQCGPHPTLATICTQAPACPPHTVHNSQCICPTPSAVGQCGPHLTPATVCTMPPGCPPHQTQQVVCHQTLNIACVGPQNTHFFCVQTGNLGCQPPFTMGGCPPFTPNGVFTPFGR